MSKTSNVIEFLKDADKECELLIEAAAEDLDKYIGPYQQRFKEGITSNIYLTFGEFLYNALGKKINSQPKNKLLDSYWRMHQEDIKSGMKASGEGNIIAYLAKKNFSKNQYNSAARTEYPITHAVVNKGFALGYVTPKSTIYGIVIPAAHIFFYLTQEHVDLITNKDKRACAQDFLNFRDNYLKILNDLKNIKTQIHDVNTTVDVAVLSEIFMANKLVETRYVAKKRSNYLILKSIDKAHVNLIETVINDTEVKQFVDKCGKLLFDVTSKNLRERFTHSYNAAAEHTIDINVYNYDDKKKKLVYFGTVRLGDKRTKSPLVIKDIKANDAVCCHGPDLYPYRFREDTVVGKNKRPNDIEQSLGYTLNWRDVISIDTIRKAVDQKIKFFEVASKTLHYLKKKHAKLVFIHGIF